MRSSIIQAISQRLEARSFQREFFEVCLRFGEPGTRTRIMALVTPGGGKQTLPYLAQTAIAERIANGFCWLTPRSSLRAQGEIIPKFLAGLLDTYGVEHPSYRAADNVADPCRGARGYITTYQSIIADPDMHLEEFKRKRYALFLDEEQFVSTDKVWIRAIRPLVERAAVLVIMSGGLYRGDGRPCAFVPYTPDGNIDLVHPDWITIQYSRTQALNAKPQAILPVEFHRHDAKVEYLDRDGNEKKFDKFGSDDEAEIRDQIRAAVTGDAATAAIIEMLDCWKQARRQHPDCQAIIVVESQPNATKRRDWMRRNYPHLRVGLAITDEPNADAVIRDFCRSRYDILITVGKAYIGMDAPAASHMALCCVYRTRAYIEQAIARVVRRHGKQTRALVVTFNDPLMLEVTKRIEEEQQESLLDRDDNDPDGASSSPSSSSSPGAGIFHISSELTDLHAHELGKSELTSELSAHYVNLAKQFDLPITPIEMHDFAEALCGMPPIPTRKAPAPIIGRREHEERLKASIEPRSRALDARRGWPWGTTNGLIMRRFGKARELMSTEELIKVAMFLTALENENDGSATA